MARDRWEHNVGITIVGGFYGFVAAMSISASRTVAVVAVVLGALVGFIAGLVFTPGRGRR